MKIFETIASCVLVAYTLKLPRVGMADSLMLQSPAVALEDPASPPEDQASSAIDNNFCQYRY